MNESTTIGLTTIDVSSLPRHAVGWRSPLWWGTVLLIAIESTCFAVLLNSYLYIRNNFQEWPPDERLPLIPGAISLGALISTALPTWFYRTAACAERFVAMRRWLLIATVLSLVSIGLRAWEIRSVPFQWTGSAYASVVWTSLVMHTVEIVTGAAESIFLCAVLRRSRVEMKSFEDVEAGALFWFFSVLVWVPFACLFYLDGRFG